jgi:(2Fe-2S) ferredoxin
MSVIKSIQELQALKKEYNDKLASYKHQILICGGAGCVSSGCAEIRHAVDETLADLGLSETTKVMETGCMGTCAVGPVMLILPERIFYTKLSGETASRIIQAHFDQRRDS